MHNGTWYSRFAKRGGPFLRPPEGVRARGRNHRHLGERRPAFRLQRHVAARCQQGHHDRHVPDGVSDPEYPGPRYRGDQLKLDELIRANKSAHNALLDLEQLEEEGLEKFRGRYQALARAARKELQRGLEDTGTPEA